MEQKIYTKFVIMSEDELNTLLEMVGETITDCYTCDENFNRLVKLYVKLLKESEDLELERENTN